MSSPERRYFAEPLAWLENEGSQLALHQERPAWASLNHSASWLVRRCASAEGATRSEVARDYHQQFGPMSDADLGQALVDLEVAGLLVSGTGTERPMRLPVAPAPSHEYRVEHLYVELLARCNLRCVHCYMEGAPERTEHLEVGEVLQVLRQFQGTGGRYITLSGGEPLIYPDFTQVAEEVAALGLRGTVITNGISLKERHLELLSRLDFNLAISMDGVTPEVNDRIRGAGSHARAVAAIDRALAALGRERFILSFTPVRQNLHELPGLFRFAVERGIRRLNLSLIEAVGRASHNRGELGLSAQEREWLVETVFENALRLVGRVEVDLNDTRNVLELFSTDRKPSELHPLWRGVRLDSSGDVYPSTFGAAPEFRLGNIRQAPLPELLESPVLRQLYENLHDRFLRTPRCRACAWRQLCRGGGVTSAYYASGDLYAPDAYCEGYLKTFPRVAEALAQLASACGE